MILTLYEFITHMSRGMKSFFMRNYGEIGDTPGVVRAGASLAEYLHDCGYSRCIDSRWWSLTQNRLLRE